MPWQQAKDGTSYWTDPDGTKISPMHTHNSGKMGIDIVLPDGKKLHGNLK
jgi:hypothetical protein